MNKIELIAHIRQGLDAWRTAFIDLDNTERQRAIEQFTEWFNNQNFTDNE